MTIHCRWWSAVAVVVFVLLIGECGRAGVEDRPRFVISPEPVPRNYPASVRLVGLLPKQLVTVHATMGVFRSVTEFVADSQGEVDVAGPQPKPKKGEPLVPMHIVWSMKRHPKGQFKRIDLPTPFPVTLAAFVKGKEVASGKFEWRFLSPKVEQIRVKEGRLRGVVFRPKGSGPFPGVVVLGGSGGGVSDWRASLLAAHGYSVLALAYFRYDDLPKNLVNIPVKYFGDGLKWFQKQKYVRSGGVVIIGASRGGELALLVGSRFPEVKAVVAITPSHVLWGGYSRKREDFGKPAWTQFGKPIPSMLGAQIDPKEQKEVWAKNPGNASPWYKLALKDSKAAERASIPVEKIKGPVLLVSGEDDMTWPSAFMAEQVMARLKKHKHPHTFRHICYSDCGHNIGIPFSPVGDDRFQRKNWVRLRGGTAAGNAHAAWDSWRQILRFLERQFGRH